ncbi:hypothetical protein H4R34_000369 [Dimargaris verticillata]|uniref:PDCD5-related protein n=1 Tax=Dimargaris verticillata TaxID=2761393 RepID=A0A9W8BC09_9FUNG|nr:hypothetical protein H4R34_000369 [Dimargaris verticillata]
MDDELQAIRARRLAELQKSQGAGSSAHGMPGMSGAGQGENEEQKRQMEEMREMMLTQILDNDARQRLTRIAMVKADKARGVEDMLIRMAKTGQLRGKVSEQQLIGLLEQLSEQTKRSEPKIVFNRRRDYDDDEDDEDYDL